MAFSGRSNSLEEGDKILLPPSALHTLAGMNVEYPMLFKLTSEGSQKFTHCGVLEFSAEEGRCYIPFWMMQNLMIGEGSLITVKNVTLPKAKFVKFRAQSCDFLEISNPRAVLEKTLRKFTCVTVGDQICIQYLSTNHFLEVREVDPGGAASIIETDCNVDFEEPVGYENSKYAEFERQAAEKKRKTENDNQAGSSVGDLENKNKTERVLQKAEIKEEEKEEPKFVPFGGSARRIDGKVASNANGKDVSSSKTGATSSSNNGNDGGETVKNSFYTAPARKSLVGKKYSKTGTTMSAFGGKGNVLK
jgi:ubiquitin fusion degradation protein 1